MFETADKHTFEGKGCTEKDTLFVRKLDVIIVVCTEKDSAFFGINERKVSKHAADIINLNNL